MTTPIEPMPTAEQRAEFVSVAAMNLINEFERCVVELTKDPMAPAYFAGLAEAVLKIEITPVPDEYPRSRFRIIPLKTEPDEPDDDTPGYL
ncbi:hypothetical protein [Streptomyces albicerus]|uniref:hypothetical protein n=1 Tax=Streptomyces albicerus TaxID=2569859 RepID=UPI00124B9B7B|nr:hypothetical protein [Streptomyces albicerus]